ncbi:hypothetical protein CERSUDRAFT_117281 [Gelatoporia subvermispora B]|uniref:Uncharacterized protein n=1 Tax=Ceriporiopsis subvermispora (strain B) TaxID=914234 RepID=M2QBP1_CERS8|nr:hypothetical protein CERSUDRAFT_117281 [Gelatoporia subvermispora B]
MVVPYADKREKPSPERPRAVVSKTSKGKIGNVDKILRDSEEGYTVLDYIRVYRFLTFSLRGPTFVQHDVLRARVRTHSSQSYPNTPIVRASIGPPRIASSRSDHWVTACGARSWPAAQLDASCR